LDSPIANVALPHMQGSLSAASDTITWVLTSYIIAAAIMTPMAGWLSGRFGRKQVFLAAVAGFTVASMLCGTAESLAQMVIYRLRSEEHTSELQSLAYLVCRLLLEKKKKKK